MLKKIICVLSAVLMLVLPVAAVDCDYSYTYNAQNAVVPTPGPYHVKATLGGELSLKEPCALFGYGGALYILDAGNARIAVLNTEYTFERYINLTNADGTAYASAELTDLFIKDDALFVVDRANECILKTTMTGEILRTFTAPSQTDGGEKRSFIPLECVVDGAGYIYVLLENEYRGLMVLDAEGAYVTYFGSVNVSVNAQVLKTMFWRRFMTEEQIEGTSQYVPGGYNGITMTEDGFIYAVRGISSSDSELVCKLNSSGKNVLTYTGSFGEKKQAKGASTAFSAIAVDGDGFIAAIDQTTKKIFRYTPDGYLMYAFAGSGDAYGLFDQPSAIAYNGSDLLVADAGTGLITVFGAEEFTRLVDEAEGLYRKARFKEAEDIWRQVLSIDGNYQLALVGIGKVAEAEKQYTAAMRYYRRGGSKNDYSSAFEKQRSAMVGRYFPWFAAAVIVGVTLWAVLKRRRIRLHGAVKRDYEHGTKAQYIRFAVLHPFDGYSQLRYNHQENPVYALWVAALLFFVSCLNYNYNGFIFNADDPEQFNMLIVLGSTVGIALLFVLCEWLLSTFFDGKGTLPQILCGVCYSLIPMILGKAVVLLLTNVFTVNEAFFIGAISTLTTLWSLALIFIAMKEIQQYSFTKNILSLLVTAAGVLAVVFLIVLFFNLMAQFISFVSAVVQEVFSRISAA